MVSETVRKIANYFLQDSIPAKMVKGAIGGMALPGDVYSGRTPIMAGEHTNPEVINRAADLSGILMGGAYGTAPAGVVGIFGGKLAANADQAALVRAQSAAAKGAPREQILRETGWFQGADGNWRFEIADNTAAVSQRVADDFAKRNVGDQVPVQNADRFLDHPELFAAYPDLWRVNTRLTKGGGYPYMPEGHYFVRESGTEGIGLNADTLGRARSMNLHELQHAVQRREGWPFGANLDEVGASAYRANPGEVEAYNVQRRMDMTPEQRLRLPPWLTE